jgi:hypothetical protein
MIELLGVLIAALLVTLGWLAWRGLKRLAAMLRLLWGGRRIPVRKRVPAMKGVKLRASRALAEAQSRRIALLTMELARTQLALRAAVAAPPPSQPDSRFRRAKRAFAALFHPDRLRCGQPELGIRTRIFQQYWQVLRGIERS